MLIFSGRGWVAALIWAQLPRYCHLLFLIFLFPKAATLQALLSFRQYSLWARSNARVSTLLMVSPTFLSSPFYLLDTFWWPLSAHVQHIPDWNNPLTHLPPPPTCMFSFYNCIAFPVLFSRYVYVACDGACMCHGTHIGQQLCGVSFPFAPVCGVPGIVWVPLGITKP